MQCLQPVDPDEQKAKIMIKYEHDFEQARKLFTLEIQQRTIHLLKHVNYAFNVFIFVFVVDVCFFFSFLSLYSVYNSISAILFFFPSSVGSYFDVVYLRVFGVFFFYFATYIWMYFEEVVSCEILMVSLCLREVSFVNFEKLLH